jgi:hypothetical protein
MALIDRDRTIQSWELREPRGWEQGNFFVFSWERLAPWNTGIQRSKNNHPLLYIHLSIVFIISKFHSRFGKSNIFQKCFFQVYYSQTSISVTLISVKTLYVLWRFPLP